MCYLIIKHNLLLIDILSNNLWIKQHIRKGYNGDRLLTPDGCFMKDFTSFSGESISTHVLHGFACYCYVHHNLPFWNKYYLFV